MVVINHLHEARILWSPNTKSYFNQAKIYLQNGNKLTVTPRDRFQKSLMLGTKDCAGLAEPLLFINYLFHFYHVKS